MQPSSSRALLGPLALLVALHLCSLADAKASKVKVKGRQIVVDGEPIHLKGVNWNPIPVGKTHPEGVDYPGFVERDSDLMKDMGVNAIRTYECVCDPAVLDVLYSKGIYVLNTVFAYASPEELSAVARKVNAVKDHPAVLMWVVGNEWNYNGCYNEKTHDECMWYIKQAAQMAKRLDSKHPVASVYGRLPSVETMANLSIIDVWGVNYYYGLNFTAELDHVYWKTDRNGTANLFEEYASISDKPFFIGEYGADCWDSRTDVVDLDAQALAIRMLTEELADNTAVNGGIVSGGMVFEFADEWWKDHTGSPFTHDHFGNDWGSGPWPDFRYNEEWWGLLDIDRKPRPAYYAYKQVQRPISRRGRPRQRHAEANASAVATSSGSAPSLRGGDATKTAVEPPPRRLLQV